MSDKRKVNLVLPFPPTTNKLYKNFFSKKINKTIRAPTGIVDKFKKRVREILGEVKYIPFNENVKVTLKLYRPRKQGDWDNFSKASIDALKRTDKKGNLICYWGLLHDDSQIKEGHIYVYDDKENPRLELEIEEI